MSYHNGSVWPHDNALIAAGLARYGQTSAAAALFEAVFDASRTFEDRRLPELYCGFERDAQRGPIPYPVACRPQAWAAGAVFLLLQSFLGLAIDGFARRILFERPHMPQWLPWIDIRGLPLGNERIDLHVERRKSGVAVDAAGTGIEVVVRR
jgi:glycogen debranching enzyme